MSNNLRSKLKNKSEYLLKRSSLPGRKVLEESFLSPLKKIGEIGLVGGAIRDLAYMRSNNFCSDLDFVIDIRDEDAFEKLLSQYKLTKNSFGGYRTQFGGLKIDFWEIKTSWVNVNNIMPINCIDDIRKSTFFNLDAIIFNLNSGELLVDNQVLEDIENKYLDINLRENPNEDGAAIRALRRLWKFDLSASERLINFIEYRVRESRWKNLVRKDMLAFPNAPLLNTLESILGNDSEHISSLLNENKGKIPREKQTKFLFFLSDLNGDA